MSSPVIANVSLATGRPLPQLESVAAPSSSGGDHDDLCGFTLLRLVGKGHSVLAELLLLSREVPLAFRVAAEAGSSSSAGGGGDVAASSGPQSYLPGLWSMIGGGGARVEDGNRSGGVTTTTDTSDRDRRTAGASRSWKNKVGNDTPESDPNASSVRRYVPLLFDFEYLRDPERCESRLQDSTDSSDSSISIEELESDFAAEHSAAIALFYGLFENVYQYQRDLNRFASDLAEGYYMQQTVESVLLDPGGRQLLCEAVYLYGMMLILLERHFEGPIRERLVVSYIRYCAKDGKVTRTEEICKLCRSTGSKAATVTTHLPKLLPSSSSGNLYNKPPGTEEKMFARYPLPPDLVQNVIGCLISEDVYLQSPSFPNFRHRSTRLARQASMLYVTLFFHPPTLHSEKSTMREIVDRYFNDNWVISLYGGTTVDLSFDWDRFDAARAALGNVLLQPNVKSLHVSNADLIAKCTAEVRNYLSGGTPLTDVNVLDDGGAMLDCMRRCAVAIRWRVLHRRASDPKYRSIINAAKANSDSDRAVSDDGIVSLLLLSSQFESELRTTYERLLRTRSETWDACRSKAVARMEELSTYYAGDQALAPVRRDEGLMEWFHGMGEEIRCLTYGGGSGEDGMAAEHFTVTGRRVHLCVQALEDVGRFDVVDRDLQVKSVLKQTKDLLLQMVRAANVKEDILDTIDCIADVSYGMEVLGGYVPAIHERIRRDPSSVALLRGLFLKLNGSLRWPVGRLTQCQSSNLTFVTEFYSSSIVSLAREILDVIPLSVFHILTQIVDIKERKLALLPLKVEVDALQDHSQPEERYKLARLTHELSIFTEGILSMEKTTIGEGEVNPLRLLEDGLRKELVRQVSVALHEGIQFQSLDDSVPASAALTKYQASMIRSLSKLAGRMEGYRRAIEYIQDYIGIAGLKIWVEEVGRIMGYYVEQESNKYLQKKVTELDSTYHSPIKPLPRFPRIPNEPSCVTFMGRIVSALLKVTDARSTTYSRDFSGWFLPDGWEVCGMKTLSVLRKAFGASGLAGIDRLLSFRILNEFQRFFKLYRTTVKQNGVLLEQIRDGLFPEWKTPPDAIQFYSLAAKKTEKLVVPITTCLCRVGQAQLLRMMISSELALCSRVNANSLVQSLSLVNRAILSKEGERFNAHRNEADHQSSPEFTNFLSDLAVATGIGNPMGTVFMDTDPLEGLPVLLLLFLISIVGKFTYDSDFRALVRSKDAFPFDGWPVAAGMATLLKQFHASYMKSFLSYAGQFVHSAIQGSGAASRQSKRDPRQVDLPLELKHTLIFASQLCSIGGLSRSVLHQYIPQYVFELCAEA